MPKPAAVHIIQAPPIALDREAAALALSISVSLLEEGVRDGRYPKPRRLSSGRVGWLYAELLAHAHALPVSDLPPGPPRRAQNPGSPENP